MGAIFVQKSGLADIKAYFNDKFAVAPAIFPVISFDSTGKAAPLMGTDGKVATTETSAASINTNLVDLGYQSQMSVPLVNTEKLNYIRQQQRYPKIVAVSGVLAGAGTIDVDLQAAYAGYQGVVQIRGIYMDGAAGGAVTFNFFEGVATAAQGMDPNATAVIPAASLPANQIFTNWNSLIVWGATDNQKVWVRATSGAGAGDNGKRVIFLITTWYET